MPVVSADAYVAPTAVVVGEVELGPQSSVWYGSVLRGDINWIKVGARSNIQDLCVLHVEYQSGRGVTVGEDVTLGHRVILHSATVEDRALIGMGAVVLDRAVIGAGALVAAGSVVPPRMMVPPATLVMGSPAKVVRDLTEEDLAANLAVADRYVRVMRCHLDKTRVEDFSRG